MHAGSEVGRGPALATSKVAVAGGYAAQGLGYAAVVTALPSFQDTWDIGDDVVSLLLLGTCVMAGIGSVAADVIALRWGSRVAACSALVVEAAALVAMAVAPAFGAFLAAVVVYGIGLGTMDAAENMQGTTLEARAGVPYLGRFYAAYTAAAGVAAFAMTAYLSTDVGAVGALITVAVLQAGAAAFGWIGFDPARERATGATQTVSDTPRIPLPRRAIWLVGTVLMAIYMLDSAVSTWSTVYLTNAFDNLSNLAPLGYALYQGTTLISRLLTDRLEIRLGIVRLALIAIGIGLLGCATVAAIPTFAGALVGFAITGVAGGILIPLTFAAAGRILPTRRDEVIARVNLFNYAGVILGAVTIGAIAHGSGIGYAFLIPALGLAAVIPLTRRLNRPV
ncbi:MAG: MFS transporter [Gordonia sp. (in: high G+C Gram-positive bacteria)]